MNLSANVYVLGTIEAAPRRPDNVQTWGKIKRIIEIDGFITKGQLLRIDRQHKQDDRFFNYCLRNRWLRKTV